MTRSQIRFFLSRIRRSLWFTPALYAMIAFGVLLLAPLVSPLLPEGAMDLIGLEGVHDLLGVLANGLLAVAIFSLGIMASSTRAAAAAATPRARPLLTEDRTSHDAISTFIGGFIYSIVGMVGLSTAYYNDASRVVLFFVTCFVILAVIVSLIRWIERVSRIGDVSEIIDMIEKAAARAFGKDAKDPHLGGAPGKPEPQDGFAVLPRSIGFVQAVSTEVLGKFADSHDTDIHLTARPGAYVDTARPLMIATRKLNDSESDKLRAAFVIGDQRTFDTDPRFGLLALSEIGSRALSSGVNDPGTAIDVIGTAVRVLAGWSDAAREAKPEVRYPRLHVQPLSVEDLLGDALRWIARDGAAQLEVQLRIQKGLATLAVHDAARFGDAARTLSQEALDRAERAMVLPQDFHELRAVATQVQEQCAPVS